MSEPIVFLNGRVTLYLGDVLAVLAGLPDDSVDCVVTSPPYWGLRDYGTAQWVGGDPDCDHRSPTMHENRQEARPKLAGSDATNSYQLRLAHRSACGKCGAVKVDQQIGLEPTLALHLEVMVRVFREVRRVLKPTGTCWVNYGDCYATSPNGRSAADTKAAGGDDRTFRDKPFSTIGGVLKAKDLCMVPNRLAIALQEDGWWVRSEIIWAKSNPMPESIRDRPATSHEKIFMLTKSARYFYDAGAVRQAPSDASLSRWAQDIERQVSSTRANGGMKTNGTMKAVGGPREKTRAADIAAPRHAGHINHTGIEQTPRGEGRNLRNFERAPVDVWEIATRPFSEAHFATFPPELAARCINAGCPKGGLVLDPFGGAGTTALVAARLGRRAVLIELNPEYAAIAQRRIEADWMGHASRKARTSIQAVEAGPLFEARP
ncbi:DNA-methyltransferase [Terrihabitans sp. B22-R8]|uniref:DNA-methyltransferase n=1 Tax=Terrihabitans sp. B22-R8 TaxID=3425128 RepID=UPI00403CC98E